MIRRLIGIGGTLGAGKDRTSDILVEDHGFVHVSTSDTVRGEALRRHRSVDRDVLRHVANELRATLGAGALCLQAIHDYEEAGAPGEGLALSGLRAIGEAQAIRSNEGLLLFVDAPIELRFSRIQGRARLGEITASLETFRAFEETELQSATLTGQNIEGVRGLSHTIIQNDRSEADLAANVQSALETFSLPIVN